MRLLEYNDEGGFSLTGTFSKETPPFGIISHTWEADSSASGLPSPSTQHRDGRRDKCCTEVAARVFAMMRLDEGVQSHVQYSTLHAKGGADWTAELRKGLRAAWDVGCGHPCNCLGGN